MLRLGLVVAGVILADTTSCSKERLRKRRP